MIEFCFEAIKFSNMYTAILTDSLSNTIQSLSPYPRFVKLFQPAVRTPMAPEYSLALLNLMDEDQPFQNFLEMTIRPAVHQLHTVFLHTDFSL